jgi:hypothetical protein
VLLSWCQKTSLFGALLPVVVKSFTSDDEKDDSYFNNTLAPAFFDFTSASYDNLSRDDKIR